MRISSLGWLIVIAACKKDGSIPSVIDAEFTADHAELGTWTARPIACEDGQGYGFKGIVFRFALPTAPPPTPEAQPAAPTARTPSTPPEEIRLDLARDGDNVIELRYPDRDGTVRRVRERECESITGSLTRYDRSTPVKIKGGGTIVCPAFGLRAKFEVSGCVP